MLLIYYLRQVITIIGCIANLTPTLDLPLVQFWTFHVACVMRGLRKSSVFLHRSGVLLQKTRKHSI